MPTGDDGVETSGDSSPVESQLLESDMPPSLTEPERFPPQWNNEKDDGQPCARQTPFAVLAQRAARCLYESDRRLDPLAMGRDQSQAFARKNWIDDGLLSSFQEVFDSIELKVRDSLCETLTCHP